MRYFTCCFATTFGPLQLFADDDALCGLLLPGKDLSEKEGSPGAWAAARDYSDHPLLREARGQILAYLEGSLRAFDLPLAPQGTAFRQAVWQQLLTIQYGETMTYGGLAARLGDKNKARAVGGAAHHNPIALIIPCHRLIGTDGGLTGFGGGLPLKRALLDLERRVCQSK
ncbi:MAG: methylated-DNA--[protein]-cysteine S-methyltransferase [Desulfobulbaceae bacterium]|jgi:methylated-DNA-[protein]-cysteine S-methyltransferase|nr:methylated-DNA--[protein]-cysteine S-methyltransferase [Desulfobulbaceae bacterium]